MSELPVLRPPYNEEAEPFWTAAAAGRLVVPVCDACGHHIWYPRSWCPLCGSDALTWRAMSGRGTVYACTVVRKATGPWGDAAPYVVAYVELEEGPRLLTNVVADDPTGVAIGDAVRASFLPLEPSADAPAQAVLRFRPA